MIEPLPIKEYSYSDEEFLEKLGIELNNGFITFIGREDTKDKPNCIKVRVFNP